jgi:hypothetical protein
MFGRRSSLYAKLWLIGTAIFFVLGATVVVGFDEELRGGKPDKPRIVWTPPSLDATLSAGGSNTFNVSFVASENLNDVKFRVAPPLQPFVQVSPSAFASVAAGQSMIVAVTVAAPATTSPRTIKGTLQLRAADRKDEHDGKDEKGGKDRKDEKEHDIAKPLPVTLNIVWAIYSNAQTGVQLVYPDFGLASKVDVTPTQSGGTRLNVQFQSPTNTNFVSGFNIFLLPNTNHLTLSEWFQQDIDPKNLLVTSGAFLQTQLGNGINAMVLTGVLPTAYVDEFGPVMSIYGISPSGNTIISIASSQANELDLYGLSPDQIDQMLREILTNLKVP